MVGATREHFQLAELYPGSGYRVRKVPVDYFTERIRARRYFSNTKINNGFWNRVLDLQKASIDWTPEGRRAADERTRRDYFLEGGFFEEFMAMLGQLPADDPDLFLGVSHLAYPMSDRITGVQPDLGAVVNLIRQTLPGDFVADDSLVWKEAVLSGRIKDFFGAIADLPVVAVGPSHLVHLEEMFHLRHFRMEAIHPTQARAHRDDTLQNLIAGHEQYHGEPVVYLFQAGTLATWFVLKLHRKLPNAFLVEVGRPLDICHRETLFQQPWARYYREDLWRHYRLAESGWERKRMAVEPASHPKRADVGKADDSNGLPVKFVEDKSIDWDFIRDAVAESAAANQWSNFGPVSRRLEQAIAGYLDLPNDRSVIACCNGTIALYALLAMHEFIAGRKLRWVVSSFGFYCCNQGPLSSARIVDCDRSGMLSIAELEKLNPTSYDGVIVTNIFGLAGDFAPYVAFCKERNKILLCDAAASLEGSHRLVPRQIGPIPDEMISFHHTKPWGMGEGGCVIVKREHEDTFRSLINFGTYKAIDTGSLSTNGKLSDWSAAFILQRLRDFTSIGDRYQVQFQRIRRLGEAAGFQLLGSRERPIGHVSTPACVPLLAPYPVSADCVGNHRVVLRKYYAPLGDHSPVAQDLYDQIVNFPCHPGMTALTDADITGIMRDILAMASTQPVCSPPAFGARHEDAIPWLNRFRRWWKGAA